GGAQSEQDEEDEREILRPEREAELSEQLVPVGRDLDRGARHRDHRDQKADDQDEAEQVEDIDAPRLEIGLEGAAAETVTVDVEIVVDAPRIGNQGEEGERGRAPHDI